MPEHCYFIYKTTNILTGYYYYGMHSTDNLDDGYLGSGKRLRYSVRKYGEENHKREILEFVDSVDELVKRESEVVTLNEIAKEKCLNLRPGGFGGFTFEQQRENARRSNERQKFLRENDPEWLKKKSERMSIASKKAYDEGRRERICFCDCNGRKHKEESKQRIGIKNSIHQLGKGNSQYGTKWITNGKINKKINKNESLKKGWRFGRII